MFLGLFFLHHFNLIDTFSAIISLFITLLTQSWILKTLGFAILVGSVMQLLEKSGGIEAFVDYMQKQKNIVKDQRSALLVPFFIGVLIFIESSITSLIAGAIGKPLCQSQKVPAAKLAFVCDSTSAPISSLIVLNGWGALLLGLITTQIEGGMISGDSVDILIDAVLYNFYAMSALMITFLVIWFGLDFGAMKKAVFKKQTQNIQKVDKTSIGFMLYPIILMIVSVFFYLYITGNGHILKGSGSSSIFYTMLSTLTFMFVYYVGSKSMSIKEYSSNAFKGGKKLFSIAMILLMAFAIGEVTSELHTGLYLASLVNENIHIYFLASLIFVLSAIIAFSTGTSWGTFSIMIPVGVPMAVALGGDIPLIIGAVISGGVFGDHCSPISDTTIISSMASECEVIEHVKTQLPYALLSGGVAFVLFFVVSFLKHG